MLDAAQARWPVAPVIARAAEVWARSKPPLQYELDLEPEPCWTCDGDGQTECELCAGKGCRNCDGMGHYECPRCGNSGVEV